MNLLPQDYLQLVDQGGGDESKYVYVMDIKNAANLIVPQEHTYHVTLFKSNITIFFDSWQMTMFWLYFSCMTNSKKKQYLH